MFKYCVLCFIWVVLYAYKLFTKLLTQKCLPPSLFPSYNDLHILAGQGTAALEVVEQMEELGVEPNAIVIPVGGGGLLAGMTTVIQHFKPDMKIIVSWSVTLLPNSALKLYMEQVMNVRFVVWP